MWQSPSHLTGFSKVLRGGNYKRQSSDFFSGTYSAGEGLTVIYASQIDCFLAQNGSQEHGGGYTQHSIILVEKTAD
jgi:hypothetical protein